MRPHRSRCSSTLSESNKPRSSGRTPMIRRTSIGCVATSRPQIRALPASNGSSPVNIFKRVDLPAPLGPSRAQIPERISSETPSTATNSPKRLTADWHEIIFKKKSFETEYDLGSFSADHRCETLLEL